MQGARVILACRDKDAGQRAAAAVRGETGNGVFHPCDDCNNHQEETGSGAPCLLHPRMLVWSSGFQNACAELPFHGSRGATFFHSTSYNDLLLFLTLPRFSSRFSKIRLAFLVAGNVWAAIVDVSSKTSIQALASQVAERFGCLHVLINSAACSPLERQVHFPSIVSSVWLCFQLQSIFKGNFSYRIRDLFEILSE